MKIPIKAAKEIAAKYKLNGVIIIGVDEKCTQLATYGKDRRLCRHFGCVGDQLAKMVSEGEIKPKTKLFIYGTLKKGHTRSEVLCHQNFLGKVKTLGKYRLYLADNHDDIAGFYERYPALVEDKNGIAIHGELWEVDHICLLRIEGIEDAPNLYQRKRVQIEGHPKEIIQTYIYNKSIKGLKDLGNTY